MKKFRKKPVVIEAWLWLFNDKQEPFPKWFSTAMNIWPDAGGVAFEPDHSNGPRLVIATPEDLMIAGPGDWIIKGVKGELYPCKPDIFEQTYDPVD